MTRTASPLPEKIETIAGAWPRRQSVPHCTPAENVIRNAIAEVEKLGADMLLTDAVILLGQARDRVADWLEGKTRE